MRSFAAHATHPRTLAVGAGLLLAFGTIRNKRAQMAEAPVELPESIWNRIMEIPLNISLGKNETKIVTVKTGTNEDYPVLIARDVYGELFALGGTCPFEENPVMDGALLFRDKLVCPHHGCEFHLPSGQNEGYPALDSLPIFKVTESKDGIKLGMPMKPPLAIVNSYIGHNSNDSRKVIIIGSGVAGFATAETLRKTFYSGQLTVPTSESTFPIWRYRLTKTTKFSDWLFIRPEDFYLATGINFFFDRPVKKVNFKLGDYSTITYSDKTEQPFEVLIACSGLQSGSFASSDAFSDNTVTLNNLGDFKKNIKLLKTAKRAVISGFNMNSIELATTLKRDYPALDLKIIEEPQKMTLVEQFGELFVEDIVKGFKKLNVEVIRGSDDVDIGDPRDTIESIQITDSKGKKTSIPLDILYFTESEIPQTTFINAKYKKEKVMFHEDRIRVDTEMRTKTRNFFAVGGVAAIRSPITDGYLDYPSFIDAMNQGEIAAYNTLGFIAYNAKAPFGYKDVLGKRIMTLGGDLNWDSMFPVGSLESGDFINYYGHKGRVIGAIASGSKVRNLLILREAISKGIGISIESLVVQENQIMDQVHERITSTANSLCQRNQILSGEILPFEGRTLFVEKDFYKTRTSNDLGMGGGKAKPSN